MLIIKSAEIVAPKRVACLVEIDGCEHRCVVAFTRNNAGLECIEITGDLKTEGGRIWKQPEAREFIELIEQVSDGLSVTCPCVVVSKLFARDFGIPYSITSVALFKESKDRPEKFNEVRRRFAELVTFLQERGLTTRTLLSPNSEVSDDAKITSADVNQEGAEIARLATRYWLPADPVDVTDDEECSFPEGLRKLRKRRPRNRDAN